MKSTGITIKAGKEVRDEAMRKLEEGTKAIEGTDGETEGYILTVVRPGSSGRSYPFTKTKTKSERMRDIYFGWGCS